MLSEETRLVIVELAASGGAASALLDAHLMLLGARTLEEAREGVRALMMAAAARSARALNRVSLPEKS